VVDDNIFQKETQNSFTFVQMDQAIVADNLFHEQDSIHIILQNGYHQNRLRSLYFDFDLQKYFKSVQIYVKYYRMVFVIYQDLQHLFSGP
jgi:hypothetical protein